MISSAVNAIVEELNDFIKIKFQLDEDRVLLSNLINLDGSVAVKEMNRVIVSVVNIHHEKVGVPTKSLGLRSGDKPPIYLNIFILFSANFDEKLKKEALRFVSAVVSFFQSKNVFTPSNTPSLDNSIERLIMDIYNLEFQDQSSIYQILGSKYLPGIMYKMRMVAIDEGLMDYSPGEIMERGTDSSLD